MLGETSGRECVWQANTRRVNKHEACMRIKKKPTTGPKCRFEALAAAATMEMKNNSSSIGQDS